MTVAALALRATAARPARLPSRVWLGAPGARALPPSLRVLLATRAIKVRGGYRYAAIVFVVRRAKAASTTAVAHMAGDDEDHGPNIFDLVIQGNVGPWNVCKHCGSEQPQAIMQGDLCDSCDIASTTRKLFQAAARKDADAARARQLDPLRAMVERDFAEGGDPGLVFGGPDRPADPSLDTGHYDDGHSFGWGTPRQPALPPRDVERVEIDLVEDIMERQPAQLVPDLELAANVDLDGDGAIGLHQRIDTRVGPIVIS